MKGLKYFPTIDDKKPKTLAFATNSIIVALFLGTLAGFFMNGPPNEIIPIYLKYFFTVFDPYFLQFVAVIHCCACLIFYISSFTNNRMEHLLNSIISIVILGLLFICFYILNDYVFKYSFNRPRPVLIEGNNVGFISKYLENVSVEGAPSGFASRGIFLLLSSTLTGFYITPRKGFAKILTTPVPIFIVQGILLILCCWARVGVGFHFWFDILIGISLGIFIFWFFDIIYKWLLTKSSLEKFSPYSAILVCIIIGFVIIGFFYSRDATRWAPSIITVIGITVVIDVYKIFQKRFNKTINH